MTAASSNLIIKSLGTVTIEATVRKSIYDYENNKISTTVGKYVHIDLERKYIIQPI